MHVNIRAYNVKWKEKRNTFNEKKRLPLSKMLNHKYENKKMCLLKGQWTQQLSTYPFYGQKIWKLIMNPKASLKNKA